MSSLREYGKPYKKNYRWKDIDINLTRKTDGDINSQKDVEAIKNSIRNIFLTLRGSRRMLPEFSYGPYDALFEPVDEVTARQLGELLFSAIERWEDRVIINNLHVTAVPNDNMFKLKLDISMKNVADPRLDNIVIEEIIQAR